MIPLVSDRTAYVVFWTPIGIALLIFLVSIVREHRKDRSDDA